MIFKLLSPFFTMLLPRFNFWGWVTRRSAPPQKLNVVGIIVQFLGSVRLAVPLLGTIAFLLIGATFYESRVGSATVQQLIYKSPWFGALMFLLAVNLGVSTALRYPWRGARKIGFALTHIGLIVIIAGSAAVIHLNTEGMLLVRTDSGPNTEIRVEGDSLEVIAPDQSRQQTDVLIRPNGPVWPRKVGELSLLGYSDRTLKTVSFVDTASVENLAVKLQLSSDRMGQTLEQWLAIAPAAYQKSDLGPAHLDLVHASDDTALGEILTPPVPNAGEWGTLKLTFKGKTLELDVKKALRTPTQLQPGTTLEITQVWPDFRMMDNNQPGTASPQFRNPALQVLVQQGDRQASWYVFGNPEFQPITSGTADGSLELSYLAPPSLPTDYFRVIVAPDGALYYATQSSQGFNSGELVPGQTIQPGWADFKIQLAQVIDHAAIQRTFEPMRGESMRAVAPSLQAEGMPALHIATPDGTDRWIPWGEPTALETPAGTYYTAFGPKRLGLPFSVALNDFIVERNEGSESVAMWTSDVTLHDFSIQQDHRRKVWMNHPTWFKGWKLAQASWNPGDLNQSTLQLKREPWWVTALTWGGSLLVVFGIGLLFYGRAVMMQLKTWRLQSFGLNIWGLNHGRSNPQDSPQLAGGSPVVGQPLESPKLAEPDLAIATDS